MSLEGCSYNCNTEYKIFDPITRSMIPCPDCYNKIREGLARGIAPADGGDLMAEYHLRHLTYTWEELVPKYSIPHLDPEKLQDVKGTIQIVCDLLGEVGGSLDRSYCFGITEKGYPERLAEPMIMRALHSGKSVAPLYTASDYNEMLIKGDVESSDALINSSVVVMIVDQGITKDGILAVKNLLERRGIRYRPTILITTWSMSALSMLLSWDGEGGSSFTQCEPHFLSYKNSTEGRKNWYMRGITGYVGTDEGADAEQDDPGYDQAPDDYYNDGYDDSDGPGLSFASLVGGD